MESETIIEAYDIRPEVGRPSQAGELVVNNAEQISGYIFIPTN